MKLKNQVHNIKNTWCTTQVEANNTWHPAPNPGHQKIPVSREQRMQLPQLLDSPASLLATFWVTGNPDLNIFIPHRRFSLSGNHRRTVNLLALLEPTWQDCWANPPAFLFLFQVARNPAENIDLPSLKNMQQNSSPSFIQHNSTSPGSPPCCTEEKTWTS